MPGKSLFNSTRKPVFSILACAMLISQPLQSFAAATLHIDATAPPYNKKFTLNPIDKKLHTVEDPTVIWCAEGGYFDREPSAAGFSIEHKTECGYNSIGGSVTYHIENAEGIPVAECNLFIQGADHLKSQSYGHDVGQSKYCHSLGALDQDDFVYLTSPVNSEVSSGFSLNQAKWMPLELYGAQMTLTAAITAVAKVNIYKKFKAFEGILIQLNELDESLLHLANKISLSGDPQEISDLKKGQGILKNERQKLKTKLYSAREAYTKSVIRGEKILSKTLIQSTGNKIFDGFMRLYRFGGHVPSDLQLQSSILEKQNHVEAKIEKLNADGKENPLDNMTPEERKKITKDFNTRSFSDKTSQAYESILKKLEGLPSSKGAVGSHSYTKSVIFNNIDVNLKNGKLGALESLTKNTKYLKNGLKTATTSIKAATRVLSKVPVLDIISFGLIAGVYFGAYVYEDLTVRVNPTFHTSLAPIDFPSLYPITLPEFGNPKYTLNKYVDSYGSLAIATKENGLHIRKTDNQWVKIVSAQSAEKDTGSDGQKIAYKILGDLTTASNHVVDFGACYDSVAQKTTMVIGTENAGFVVAELDSTGRPAHYSLPILKESTVLQLDLQQENNGQTCRAVIVAIAKDGQPRVYKSKDNTRLSHLSSDQDFEISGEGSVDLYGNSYYVEPATNQVRHWQNGVEKGIVLLPQKVHKTTMLPNGLAIFLTSEGTYVSTPSGALQKLNLPLLPGEESNIEYIFHLNLDTYQYEDFFHILIQPEKTQPGLMTIKMKTDARSAENTSPEVKTAFTDMFVEEVFAAGESIGSLVAAGTDVITGKDKNIEISSDFQGGLEASPYLFRILTANNKEGFLQVLLVNENGEAFLYKEETGVLLPFSFPEKIKDILPMEQSGQYAILGEKSLYIANSDFTDFYKVKGLEKVVTSPSSFSIITDKRGQEHITVSFPPDKNATSFDGSYGLFIITKDMINETYNPIPQAPFFNHSDISVSDIFNHNDGRFVVVGDDSLGMVENSIDISEVTSELDFDIYIEPEEPKPAG